MADREYSRLQNRIEGLERQNRWWRGIATLALVGSIIAFAGAVREVVADSDPDLEALRVGSLDVINGDGDIVAHLGVRSSGAGGLWITNAAGERVLVLNQNDRGDGRISIRDAEGEEGQRLEGGGE
jgi:hypothetical protein